MSKKNKKTQEALRIVTSSIEDAKLEREVTQHLEASKRYMSGLYTDFDEHEEMLLGKTNDAMSGTITKSTVHDPQASTIVLERAMKNGAADVIGHAYAGGKDDPGKSKLMDMLLEYFTSQANEQADMKTKRFWLDLYSLVYGSAYALVPWRINLDRNYMGPEMIYLPIRDVLPQPNVTLGSANWCTVRSFVPIEWLKSQNKDVWKNIDDVERIVKESGGDQPGSESDERSVISEDAHPDNQQGDKAFPMVKIYTEYRLDKWVTFFSKSWSGKNNTRILRVVENPFDGMLPLVKKDAFPLPDRAVGLGMFERVSKLQKSKDSLINLYMDGVKRSIFPPIQINGKADGLVPSSIHFGSGAEKWFVGRPNVDVQMTNISPQGLNTFESTYGFLTSSLQNGLGSTATNQSANMESMVGKTPQAVEFMRNREGGWDAWDREMMDKTIEEVYTRWIHLIVNKLDRPVIKELYGADIEDIKQINPDVMDLIDGNQIKISKKNLASKYDYKVDSGAVARLSPEQQSMAAMQMLQMLMQNPTIDQRIMAEGKQVNYSELISRAFASSGIKDWDKVITIAQQQPMQGQPGMPGQPMQPEQSMVQEQLPPVQYSDPEIGAVANEILGGMSNIPANG